MTNIFPKNNQNLLINLYRAIKNNLFEVNLNLGKNCLQSKEEFSLSSSSESLNFSDFKMESDEEKVDLKVDFNFKNFDPILKILNKKVRSNKKSK